MCDKRKFLRGAALIYKPELMSVALLCVSLGKSVASLLRAQKTLPTKETSVFWNKLYIEPMLIKSVFATDFSRSGFIRRL